MTFQKFAAAALAAAFLSGAAAAQAQTIPGVCVLDQGGVVGTSAVGKYVNDRMKQLGAQVNAELQPQATTLQSDEKAFLASRSTLSAAEANRRGQALQQREAAFEQTYQLRQRELQATVQKAMERISVELEPILRNVATQHSCSLMLSQSSLMLPAPTMDVTGAVVQQLDAKIQQFPFEREHLDQQAPAAQ